MYEWCVEGIEFEIDNFQDVFMSFFLDWFIVYFNGEVMYILNVQQLFYNGFREVLELQGIKSLLVVFMYQGDCCVGFVGFDFVKSYYVYIKQEMEFFCFFVQVLVNIFFYIEECVKLLASQQEF